METKLKQVDQPPGRAMGCASVSEVGGARPPKSSPLLDPHPHNPSAHQRFLWGILKLDKPLVVRVTHGDDHLRFISYLSRSAQLSETSSITD